MSHGAVQVVIPDRSYRAHRDPDVEFTLCIKGIARRLILLE